MKLDITPRAAHYAATEPAWAIPASVARQLGVGVCHDCGRGIAPGRAVAWGGDVYHVECIAERLGAAR